MFWFTPIIPGWYVFLMWTPLLAPLLMFFIGRVTTSDRLDDCDRRVLLVVLMVSYAMLLGIRAMLLSGLLDLITPSGVLLIVLASVAQWLALWVRLRGKPDLDQHCRACRYDLTNNTSGRCPECGVAIPLNHREWLAASRRSPT